MHSCMLQPGFIDKGLHSIRAPPTFIYLYGCDNIWQAAERWYYTSLLGELFFEDSRRQYVLFIRRYPTNKVVWLITCVLRNHNNGVKHSADNWSWWWTRQIYIVVSLKTNFKRHMPGEFHDCSWVFWSRHCSHMVLGEWKKEEIRRKRRWRNSIFIVFRFVTLVTISSNPLATVRWGNAREQI